MLFRSIPFRGHRDSGRSTSDEDTVTNEGNFRALLRYRVRGGDDVSSMYLFEGAGNAQYLSPEVQNCLLNISLSSLQQTLLELINKSPCWSLLCDKTTDRMKRERERAVMHCRAIYF